MNASPAGMYGRPDVAARGELTFVTGSPAFHQGTNVSRYSSRSVNTVSMAWSANSFMTALRSMVVNLPEA